MGILHLLVTMSKRIFDPHVVRIRSVRTQSEPIADLRQQHNLNRTVQIVDRCCKEEGRRMRMIQRIEQDLSSLKSLARSVVAVDSVCDQAQMHLAMRNRPLAELWM